MFEEVMQHCAGLRRPGAAALDLCYVAAGRADGFWEVVLKPWDMHAGRLVVAEAGGRSTRLDGGPLGLGAEGLVATNGLVHDELVAVLAEAEAAATA
jgi:myo-inositol-1(or 4)-monophosphatase